MHKSEVERMLAEVIRDISIIKKARKKEKEALLDYVEDVTMLKITVRELQGRINELEKDIRMP